MPPSVAGRTCFVIDASGTERPARRNVSRRRLGQDDCVGAVACVSRCAAPLAMKINAGFAEAGYHAANQHSMPATQDWQKLRQNRLGRARNNVSDGNRRQEHSSYERHRRCTRGS